MCINKNVCSPFLKQCFVTATVCMNVFSNGCAYGFPAILLPQLKGSDSKITVTKAEESWIVSVITIAMLMGNLSIPFAMNKIGRKKVHLITTLPAATGWLLIVFATNLPVLILARIMHGVSVGQMLSIRVVILGEYTSPHNRGAFLTTSSLALASGIFFVHLVGKYIAWQRNAYICVLFNFLSFIMTIFIPESPSWLAGKGKYERCKQEFHLLRGDRENNELDELIRARMESNQTEKPGLNFRDIRSVITKDDFYKPIVIAVHTSLMLYVAGGMNLAVYGTTIVSLIMGPTVDAHFWLVSLDVVRIITSIIAIYYMKALKRRTVMLSSATLCIFAHVCIIAFVVCRNYGVVCDYVWIPAVFLNIQCFSVSLGILPINSVIAGEIFPFEYRGVGISFSVSIATTFHFALLKLFPYLASSIGIEGTYGINTGIIVYCATILWIMMPETKDRTLQQIEDRLRQRQSTVEAEEESRCISPS